MNKATAVSPANIAFVKFWGLKNKELILAYNDSISMNLSNCITKTTVEFSPKFKKHQIYLDLFGKGKQLISGKKAEKIINQLERIKKLAKNNWFAQVYSQTNFPSEAGIAASASAFSALTLAAATALKLNLSNKQLSALTRLSGSGSACRSIVDGFSHWHQDHATQIAKAEHWPELTDIVAVVDANTKKVSSFDGHKLALSSPYFKARIKEVEIRVILVIQAIKQKDFKTLGEQAELDTLSMHFVMMTSRPGIFALSHKTWKLIEEIKSWRKEGLEAYFTIDNGPNVHILCLEKDKTKILQRLKKIPEVLFIIVNKNCQGARIV